jgi:lipid A 3-O-deacylase
MPCHRRTAVLLAAFLAIPFIAAAEEPVESPGWVPAKTDAARSGFVHLEIVTQSAAEVLTVPDRSAPPLTAPAPETGVEALFRPGTVTTQVLGGAYFNVNLGPSIPTFNYVPVVLREGWMLTCPTDHLWGYGNYECLFDITGAAITSNYGHWFAGPSFYLRFNWLPPGSCIVPYAQVGTGAVFNDAYKDQSQRAIGQSLEFYQHVELGLKYFVAPNMSLDVEGGLQHLSNGGLARRNLGVNAVGAMVGLTYYLPNGQ